MIYFWHPASALCIHVKTQIKWFNTKRMYQTSNRPVIVVAKSMVQFQYVRVTHVHVYHLQHNSSPHPPPRCRKQTPPIWQPELTDRAGCLFVSVSQIRLEMTSWRWMDPFTWFSKGRRIELDMKRRIHLQCDAGLDCSLDNVWTVLSASLTDKWWEPGAVTAPP